MYYISMAVQHVGLRHGRSLKDCILLSVSRLRRAIICVLPIVNFFQQILFLTGF